MPFKLSPSYLAFHCTATGLLRVTQAWNDIKCFTCRFPMIKFRDEIAAKEKPTKGGPYEMENTSIPVQPQSTRIPLLVSGEIKMALKKPEGNFLSGKRSFRLNCVDREEKGFTFDFSLFATSNGGVMGRKDTGIGALYKNPDKKHECITKHFLT